MRTQEEIVGRYSARKEMDMLGFEVVEYFKALDWDHVQPFIKQAPEHTRERWDAMEGRFRTDDDIAKAMREYVYFAYDKIDNERGISANRTIMRYIAWIWLLGDEKLLAWVEREYETNYHSYGRHIVDRIVRDLGLRGTSATADKPARQSGMSG